MGYVILLWHSLSLSFLHDISASILKSNYAKLLARSIHTLINIELTQTDTADFADYTSVSDGNSKLPV